MSIDCTTLFCLTGAGLLLCLTCAVISQPTSGQKGASFAVFDQKAQAGQALDVVFFGGSLTWGANASDPQRTSYRALMTDYLRTRYPQAIFRFHDAAIGGTGSHLGMFRLERDVLSHQPDLVFLDFTANDDPAGADLSRRASYEALLRELIGRDIPVVQVFLGFKYNFDDDGNPKALQRVIDHKKLAGAYNTGTGDSIATIQARVEAGTHSLDDIWPLDEAHPEDLGYRIFFEGVRDGFEEAVAERRVCRVPTEPVFSDQYSRRQRIRLIDLPPINGWQRSQTYRTSLWYDGLSSRWMDDVLVCGGNPDEPIEPLHIEFAGTFVGVFGEADQDGLSFRATIDGKPVQSQQDGETTDRIPFNTSRFGTGRLFVWRELETDLSPGRHFLEIHPVVNPESPKGQLRIESICVAGPLI